MQTMEMEWTPTEFAHESVSLPAVEPPDFDAEAAELADMSIEDLREAVRGNQVSFPSQIPIFAKRDRPDLQMKLVQLYFVLGWSCQKAGERYGLTRARVWQILTTWKRCAAKVGYIQIIPRLEPVELPIPAVRAWLSPELRRMPPSPITAAAPHAIQNADSPGATRIYRRRSKADMPQILAVLRQLAAGRSAAEMAGETGVSTDTIRTWREKYGSLANETEEMRSLRLENERLKQLVADLSAGKDLMINPIRKSYSLSA